MRINADSQGKCGHALKLLATGYSAMGIKMGHATACKKLS